MELREMLNNVEKRYSFERTDKVSFGNEMYRLIVEQIPNELKEVIDLSSYKVKGSIGNGNASEVPCVAIMDPDITSETTKGFYIVFLFATDSKTIYLTLNQGVTYFNKNKLSKEQIRSLSKNILKRLFSDEEDTSAIDLNAKNALEEGYERTTIKSFKYEVDNMPEDRIIIENINQLVTDYQKMKDYYIQNDSDLEKFYTYFSDEADQYYKQFKYLLRNFINQANDNINKNSSNKRTTELGKHGLEENGLKKIRTYSSLVINKTEFHVHLFSSGSYGPKNGEGSSKVPYFDYQIGKNEWANIRVIFDNYRAIKLKFVIYNDNKTNREIGNQYDIDKLELNVDDQPNHYLKHFYDEFLAIGKNKMDTQMNTDSNFHLRSFGWNKILYGPPGTGKTYSINQFKEDLIDDVFYFKNDSKMSDLTWRETILIAMNKQNNEALKIKELVELDFISEFSKTKKSVDPSQTISKQLQTDAEHGVTNISANSGYEYFTKNDQAKWYLTDKGLDKAKELCKEVLTPNDRFKLVTFHQSYGYEDFIEGISARTESGQISYHIKKGVFNSFCNIAKQYPEKNFLFVIDEINRGNISKIFGELITLIEPTKRMGAEESLSVTLPYSGEIFGVPKNVFILGTMNTADRSITMMDTALRRRFEFIEKMPDANLLKNTLDDIDGINISEILNMLNQRIEFLYDREHTLGHAFFISVSTIDDLQLVFENKIIPLLQEYFYEDYQKIKAVLNDINQIYIKPVKIKDNIFNDEFSDLINDYEDERFTLNSNVQKEEFKKFISQIIN